MDEIDKRMLRALAQGDQAEATIVETITTLPSGLFEFHRQRVLALAEAMLASDEKVMGFILLLGAYYSGRIALKAAYDEYKNERDKTP
jgi:hypothetical protein